MSNRSKIVMPSQPNMTATDAGEFGQMARAMLRQPVVVRKAVPVAADADTGSAHTPKEIIGGPKNQPPKNYQSSSFTKQNQEFQKQHGNMALGRDGAGDAAPNSAALKPGEKRISPRTKKAYGVEGPLNKPHAEHIEKMKATPVSGWGKLGKAWAKSRKGKTSGQGDDAAHTPTGDADNAGEASVKYFESQNREHSKLTKEAAKQRAGDADSEEFYKKLDNLPATRPRNHPGAAKVVKVNRETQKPEPKSKDADSSTYDPQTQTAKPRPGIRTTSQHETIHALSQKLRSKSKDSVAWGGNPSHSSGTAPATGYESGQKSAPLPKAHPKAPLRPPSGPGKWRQK